MPLGGNLSSIELPGALVLLWSMLFGTALPYALYLVGIGRVGPTLGLLSGTIEPIVAVIAAWLWIDQRLTALQVLGCVVVFAAVIAVQMPRSRQRSRPSADAGRWSGERGAASVSSWRRWLGLGARRAGPPTLLPRDDRYKVWATGCFWRATCSSSTAPTTTRPPAICIGVSDCRSHAHEMAIAITDSSISTIALRVGPMRPTPVEEQRERDRRAHDRTEDDEHDAGEAAAEVAAQRHPAVDDVIG